jgi:Catalytic LigB subunit of aromatic ring-opening dioxygenase
MAQLVAAVTPSHVPSIGIAMDTGISQDPYWKPLFDGYLPAKQLVKELRPDVTIVVYNDHGLEIFLDCVPTFGIGAAASRQDQVAAFEIVKCLPDQFGLGKPLHSARWGQLRRIWLNHGAFDVERPANCAGLQTSTRLPIGERAGEHGNRDNYHREGDSHGAHLEHDPPRFDLRCLLGPRCGLAGRKHVPASALAASQTLHESGDRSAQRDRQARQRRAGQHPDVSAT